MITKLTLDQIREALDQIDVIEAISVLGDLTSGELHTDVLDVVRHHPKVKAIMDMAFKERPAHLAGDASVNAWMGMIIGLLLGLGLPVEVEQDLGVG